MFNTPGPTIDEEDRRLKLLDGNVQLGGKTYPVLSPKPLQHGFKWDDNDFRTSQKKQMHDMGFQRAKLIQALSQRCDAGQAATRQVSSDSRLQYHTIVAASVSDWSYSGGKSFILHRTKMVV